MALQRAPAESPTAGDEEIVETADQPELDAPESSAGTDDNTASSAEPSDAPSERAAEKPPTALDKLKAQLVTKAPTDDPPAEIADDPAEATSEPDAEPAADEAKAEPTEAAKDEAADDDDDPLHGFTEKEVKHPSNKGMVTRIRDLALERKKLKQKVQELEPVREAGHFLTKFQTDAGLANDEVVAALELSAAFKRGDPKALEELEAAASTLRAHLGMPEISPEPAEIEPLKGALSQEYQDMVNVLGFPEAEVRLFAAYQAKLKATPAPAARPQPRPAPRPVAPVAPQVDRARLQQLATAANETVLDYLETAKIPRDKAQGHIQKNLWPYLTALSPGNDPKRLQPEDRLRIVQLAQQKWTLARAKAAAAERAKNPSPPKSTTTTAPATSAKSPRTELDKLRMKMVGR